MASVLPTIEIKTDPARPTWGAAYINGVFVPGLVSIHLDMTKDAFPEVTLSIRCVLKLSKVENGNPEKI
jgi:hypothetical protein